MYNLSDMYALTIIIKTRYCDNIHWYIARFHFQNSHFQKRWCVLSIARIKIKPCAIYS